MRASAEATVRAIEPLVMHASNMGTSPALTACTAVLLHRMAESYDLELSCTYQRHTI